MFEEVIAAFEQKTLPHSEIEFSGQVPVDTLLSYRREALTATAASLALPGFRKGFVPVEVAEKHVGDMAILEEAAERFIRDFYPELIAQKKLDAVGRPNIRITKLAPGNPLELTIRTALYPAITLPQQWQHIAKDIPKIKATEVTETEVNEALESLLKSRTKDGTVPELTDEFAQSVGAFKDVATLTAKLKEGVGEEKALRVREKHRGAVLDALLAQTTIDMPAVFVESELEKMLSQLKDDIARFHISFDDYLTRVGKSEEQLRDEHRAHAEKRAKVQLILNAIAASEHLSADEATVEAEMKQALIHFPNAKSDLLRIHIETVLRNEKTLQMLENQNKTS